MPTSTTRPSNATMRKRRREDDDDDWDLGMVIDEPEPMPLRLLLRGEEAPTSSTDAEVAAITCKADGGNGGWPAA